MKPLARGTSVGERHQRTYVGKLSLGKWTCLHLAKCMSLLTYHEYILIVFQSAQAELHWYWPQSLDISVQYIATPTCSDVTNSLTPVVPYYTPGNPLPVPLSPSPPPLPPSLPFSTSPVLQSLPPFLPSSCADLNIVDIWILQAGN